MGHCVYQNNMISVDFQSYYAKRKVMFLQVTI